MNQKEVQAFFDELVKKNGGKEPSMEELNQQFGKFVEQQNNRPIEEFEGYSPEEMRLIRGGMSTNTAIVQFQDLSAEDCEQIPIFRQAKYLLNEIVANNGLKLTVKGNLPLKIVAQMHLLAEGKPSLFNSTMKEYESYAVSVTRELLTMAGLIKKLHNKLELTKQGKKVVNDHNEVFAALFTNFALQYDWSSNDGYGLPDIATDAWKYSFVLVGKYGNTERESNFYAEKYFKAFPYLLKLKGWSEYHDKTYGSVEKYCSQAYTLRTFNRFMWHFGLVTIEGDSLPQAPDKIKKTALFDKFVKIVPPKSIK